VKKEQHSVKGQQRIPSPIDKAEVEPSSISRSFCKLTSICFVLGVMVAMSTSIVLYRVSVDVRADDFMVSDVADHLHELVTAFILGP
jgi:hypothetical protein